MIRHDPQLDVRKMGPLFSSSTEGLSMSDVRISSFNALYFFPDESIVCRGNSLSLFGRSVNERWWAWKLIKSCSSRRQHKLS
nr:hypothetical protein Iba_scaffold43858CG0010 [Ipomoea batatas]GMD32425.1 hypothetical protein Iba_scaffold43858CG0020 [Ipomoea batatas]GMD82492.1 hypothetical protein Iba_chr13fCG8630 [Ipomoea batatas]